MEENSLWLTALVQRLCFVRPSWWKWVLEAEGEAAVVQQHGEQPSFLAPFRSAPRSHTMGVFSCEGEQMILKWPSLGLGIAPALPVLHIPA